MEACKVAVSAIIACPIATPEQARQELQKNQRLSAPARPPLVTHAAQIPDHLLHHHHPPRRDFLGLLGALALGLVAADAADAAPSCELSVAPSGLGFCDTQTGSGLQASEGMLIKANYVGRLENGDVFDSSYNRGKPLTFRVGVGEVIKGWDEGILGGDGVPPMLAGGKRTLRIPPQLGYGERGAGCRGGSCIIPPNSVLLFDVEFVGKV